MSVGPDLLLACSECELKEREEQGQARCRMSLSKHPMALLPEMNWSSFPLRCSRIRNPLRSRRPQAALCVQSSGLLQAGAGPNCPCLQGPIKVMLVAVHILYRKQRCWVTSAEGLLFRVSVRTGFSFAFI